ncbi:MAG: GNAT family N-acetyltransferase [cyanobacterium endosymbiont of Rhopalodia musculus]|uniref:GNAT family N-acetyltransferase n=1 Tax=cyanobacterium endosymbiont of Epithemia clementina EcSB TaxID=3034674 RepID=UPI002480CFD4|nr:GNAT family N-acetyltransferase [cyanobacterium endosymbiont of Epithemia clementina EcSB]WGT68305.1 GNAT family N-acetyltransferase [cyanobacterium endosymbiont of Epithemia clementina EcSB]
MVEQIKPQYSIAWIKKIAEIPKAAWDELAQTLKTPFLEWEWLNNIEISQSAIPGTGWQPNHLTIWRDKQLIGAAPLYIKSHSYGEFVFDHQWVNLFHRLGVPYYPKLLGMTPFTPAVGYRFLIAPKEDETEITQLMMTAIDHFCDRNRLSGCHFLFVDPDWRQLMENNGFSSWLHHSYIWSNKGFNSFDDYLAVFNANQRRNIKRERKAVIKAGLEVKTFIGEDIPHNLFPLIYKFYSSTCEKFYWGSQYLTSKFFEQLYPHYRHRIVLVAAYTEDNNQCPVAMSFCLRKGENLYGRYWGCLEEYDCLHFETCYYQPIQWAIQEKISMFDPGAGGLHKQRRGFAATPNHSLHRFYDRKMSQILRHYIGEVNEMEQEEIDTINQNLPFSKH